MANLSPWVNPVFTWEDADGDPLSGAKIYTYLAGLVTPATTWLDQAGATANSNPIIANAAGRTVIYGVPGTSYGFIVRNSADVTQYSQDNVQPAPLGTSNQDETGTAGESLAAGSVVYLSDGSGSKTAGQWFLADADFTYASTLPPIGMVPSAIASAAMGTIRTAGVVTGLSALTVGTDYYVSATAGALTATQPSNVRWVGRATATDTISIFPNPAPVLGLDILQVQVFS